MAALQRLWAEHCSSRSLPSKSTCQSEGSGRHWHLCGCRVEVARCCDAAEEVLGAFTSRKQDATLAGHRNAECNAIVNAFVSRNSKCRDGLREGGLAIFQRTVVRTHEVSREELPSQC